MAKMLSFVLKNFFSKPVTRLYPYNKREPFDRFRGRILCDDSNCIYCTLCAKKCPVDAITVNRSGKSWELDAFRCIVCGECVSACPKKCISMNNERRIPSSQKERVILRK
jgi:ech hydrogenase subunit F